MKLIPTLSILLALGFQSVSAQSLLETFGSNENQFSMEFVTIGNPNNAPDTTGDPNPAGSVAYIYNLGKHEVSRDMITKANAAGSLGITMYNMGSYGGNGPNRPATGLSWYEAAKFVNYLNTSTGGTAAYKFDSSGNFQLWSAGDLGYDANNMFRNSQAKYVITSSSEWYKGAYGSPNGTWFNYPTGSDSAPTGVANGTDANTAVTLQSGSTGPADITSAGGLSAYGTMGQGGNLWEFMETAFDGSNNTANESRERRGGSWQDVVGISTLGASSRGFLNNPAYEGFKEGFRVAAVGVPEPSALSLLAIGLGGLALVRRKK
jgi:formylglycine-generating enzyme